MPLTFLAVDVTRRSPLAVNCSLFHGAIILSLPLTAGRVCEYPNYDIDMELKT
jgi:hypothetical protein